MSLLRGSLLVTGAAAAVAARSDVPLRVILPDSGETFPDSGIVLEDADFPRLRE